MHISILMQIINLIDESTPTTMQCMGILENLYNGTIIRTKILFSFGIRFDLDHRIKYQSLYNIYASFLNKY